MIRVAFDIHTIGQHATGNETYAEGLLRAFEAEPPADVEIRFYHAGGVPRGRGAERYRRLWPRWPYLRIPVVTPYFLALDRIDVAHFQYIAPPLLRCATVLTVHDLSFERHPEFFSPFLAARMRLLMPYMARKATHIIAVSEATRNDLVELYGIAPGRITVIHNGHSSECRVVDRDIGLERPFVLCVGNLGSRKNQQRLVRVFARLVCERRIAHDLVLVGKPTESAEGVLSEIGSCGAGDRIHVTGFVTQTELIALYNMATISVYPSLYEGFGLPILESMACGTPVITSSVSCMPEIAGEAALLVDPGDDDALLDAVARLLESESLRSGLRAAGLARSGGPYRHRRGAVRRD